MLRQQQAVEVILSAVRENVHVRAAFLKGSLGRGAGDAYSDVDFYCIVHAEQVETFLAERRGILERYRPILFWADVNFVGPQAVVVFDDGLHMDFYAITAENIPMVGAAKALYDPENLLADYQATTLAVDFKEVLRHFESFTFLLVQIESAFGRGHHIWLGRLVSLLPFELSFMVRYLTDPDYAQLGLKDIDRVLDQATRERFLQAAQAPLLESTLLYIDLMRAIAEQYPDEQRAAFNWTFFDFMQRRIEWLRGE